MLFLYCLYLQVAENAKIFGRNGMFFFTEVVIHLFGFSFEFMLSFIELDVLLDENEVSSKLGIRLNSLGGILGHVFS